MKHSQKIYIVIQKQENAPECGGILVTNYGDGISCTFCVDCDYNEYDYD